MLSTWTSLQENLQQWLTDEKARDQLVIRAGSDTEVLWNDARHLKPEPVYKRAVSGYHISNYIFFSSKQSPFVLYNYLGFRVNDHLCFLLQFWTESFVQWSPLGTYLATIHRQGAAVWGGASTFNRLMRYAHPQVIFGFQFN